MTNLKQNISSSAKLMAKKPGTVVTYDEGTPPMISHDTLTMWSREVTRQVERLISPLPEGL